MSTETKTTPSHIRAVITPHSVQCLGSEQPSEIVDAVVKQAPPAMPTGKLLINFADRDAALAWIKQNHQVETYAHPTEAYQTEVDIHIGGELAIPAGDFVQKHWIPAEQDYTYIHWTKKDFKNHFKLKGA